MNKRHTQEESLEQKFEIPAVGNQLLLKSLGRDECLCVLPKPDRTTRTDLLLNRDDNAMWFKNCTEGNDIDSNCLFSSDLIEDDIEDEQRTLSRKLNSCTKGMCSRFKNSTSKTTENASFPYGTVK